MNSNQLTEPMFIGSGSGIYLMQKQTLFSQRDCEQTWTSGDMQAETVRPIRACSLVSVCGRETLFGGWSSVKLCF